LLALSTLSLMPILMPSSVQLGSGPCIDVPSSWNQCQSVQLGAATTHDFKTARASRCIRVQSSASPCNGPEDRHRRGRARCLAGGQTESSAIQASG
jgi:hypothetical protein